MQRRVAVVFVVGSLFAVGGCGGSKGKPIDHATPTVTVGGTVSGLSGSGLTLVNNGDKLAISGNGAFTFKAAVPVGEVFAVSVAQQPTQPSQTCSVAQPESKTPATNVTDLAVTCTTHTSAVGGTVVGLKGSGLVLQDNSGDDLAVSADGAFKFATPVLSGATYTVTIKTQPSTPTQACHVIGGSGTIVDGDVSSVAVNCSTSNFTIGGTVSGLAGSVVLQDNGGDDLTLTANGSFAFATPVTSGGAFAVTVKTQPTSPTQVCAVSSGSGTVASGNVGTVVVTCTTSRYTVGGSVSGLSGSGLVLQDNAGDNLSVSASGSFTFATSVASGAAYAVTVKTQPTGLSQTCSVTSGSGTVGSANVTNVAVSCVTNSYSISATVSGLAGSGLVLQDNGGDDLTVSGSGSVTFATKVTSGATFTVSVKTNPSSPTQTCNVSGGTGTVGGSDVSSVLVNCATNSYAIGGTVGGLAGSGLALTLNGGTPLPISGNGTFAFPTTIASGLTYTVAIAAQPSSPSQTCTLSGETGDVGSADVSSVGVSCTINSFTIGGSVSGLAGSGLVLQNNAGDDLTISTGGTSSFTFATSVASGQVYLVSVKTQPASPTQTCTVLNAAGTVGGANVLNVAVSCTTNTYNVGGTLSGLVGSVVLRDNNGDDLTLNSNSSFTFATQVASGSAYSVTVFTQPSSPAQTCTVTNDAAGTIGASDVSDITVVCTTNMYFIGGTVVGLTGSGLVLQNNGGDDLPAPGALTSFQFVTKVASGSTYAVTIETQPSGQICSVAGGSGTVGGADVGSVTINCSTLYTIGGTVSGLGSATGLVLQDNGGDDLTISADGSFAFATPIVDGGAYLVSVLTQPTTPWETCTVAPATAGANVSGGNVTSVTVTCIANPYNVIVNVSGLLGSGLMLQDNLADNLTISGNGTATFATQVASGQPYSVTILTSPSSPTQTCWVTSPTGTMGGADITLDVACAVPSQVAFTTPGLYTWTVPAGVTSVSVVIVGGGGGGMYDWDPAGGGGALAYGNAIPVTPGATLSLFVANGGLGGYVGAPAQTGGPGNSQTIGDGCGQPGQESWFVDSSTLYAEGGASGCYGGGGTHAGFGGSAMSGGGQGGTGSNYSSQNPGGSGGGGVGILGGSSGGDGALSTVNGAGGGAGGYDQSGGDGQLGTGTDAPGAGGSGGASGVVGNTTVGGVGGAFGGGGGGGPPGYPMSLTDVGAGGSGGGGAVRIIWGFGRAFPNANTGDM